MFFSVIIPTRNRIKYLKSAIKNIQRQTFTDFEIIIIDDGSNNIITAEYNKIIPRNKKINLVIMNPPTKKGMGASVARNVGLKEAKGKYITFCDDDDEWTDPNHLLIAHETLNKNNADIYIANQNAIYEDGKVGCSDWFPHLTKNIHKYESISKENNIFLLNINQLLKESEIPSLNTLVIKKEISVKINGFWGKLTNLEDRDFYLRALEYCNIICFRKDIVCQHNIPEPAKRSSISNSIIESEEHILMITVLNHVLANTSRNEIINYCRMFLGWKYRSLSFITQKQSKLVFASNGLSNLFTIKWFIYTFYLKIKYIFGLK